MAHLRVLVIDDSLTIRAMIEQIVATDSGSRVVGVASDVADAKRMLGELLPNVITLDLAMPSGSGLEFLDYLRGRVHAPVVVVSSSTTEGADATAEALAHGADACFDKAAVISNADGFLRVLMVAMARGHRTA